MAETLDVSAALVAKSDQLNAADLTGGPIVVRIESIRRSTGQADMEKQPYELVITAPWKPWRPCKTMLRLLAALWGTNGAKWTGHTIRLHRDPDVTFGKDEVGGIRMDGADVAKATTITLPVRRGQVKRYTVEPIPPLSTGRPDSPAKPPTTDPPAVAAVKALLPTRIGIIAPPLTSDEKRALMVHFGDCSGVADNLSAMDDAAFTAAILTGCGRVKPEAATDTTPETETQA